MVKISRSLGFSESRIGVRVFGAECDSASMFLGFHFQNVSLLIPLNLQSSGT